TYLDLEKSNGSTKSFHLQQQSNPAFVEIQPPVSTSKLGIEKLIKVINKMLL
ncbi:4210_t:CDS:1, partial [Racocetra fulgida]